MLLETATAQFGLHHLEDFFVARLHRLRQGMPWQPTRWAVAYAWHLDRFFGTRHLRQCTGVADLDLFGFGRGRAQHVRDVFGDLVAGYRQ